MLSLYAAFPDDFDPANDPLLVTIDALEVPLWCERFERRGQTGAVAAFADLDTERRAQELVGREFRLAEREDEPQEDEFYLEDLIGFGVEASEVAAEGGEGRTVRARLADYYDSEANPLFELEIGADRVLVPAVEEFIAHIDFERRHIRMVLPAGLLDLR